MIDKGKENYQEQCAIRMIDLEIGDYENRILYGDMARSLEVLDNLMENAFKYGDGRKIEFTFYEEEYAQLEACGMAFHLVFK